MFSQQQSEHLKKRLQNDQRLLDSIKAKLTELEELLVHFRIFMRMASIAFIIIHSRFINYKI
jgi:hypothetical protein